MHYNFAMFSEYAYFDEAMSSWYVLEGGWTDSATTIRDSWQKARKSGCAARTAVYSKSSLILRLEIREAFAIFQCFAYEKEFIVVSAGILQFL